MKAKEKEAYCDSWLLSWLVMVPYTLAKTVIDCEARTVQGKPCVMGQAGFEKVMGKMLFCIGSQFVDVGWIGTDMWMYDVDCIDQDGNLKLEVTKIPGMECIVGVGPVDSPDLCERLILKYAW